MRCSLTFGCCQRCGIDLNQLPRRPANSFASNITELGFCPSRHEIKERGAAGARPRACRNSSHVDPACQAKASPWCSARKRSSAVPQSTANTPRRHARGRNPAIAPIPRRSTGHDLVRALLLPVFGCNAQHRVRDRRIDARKRSTCCSVTDRVRSSVVSCASWSLARESTAEGRVVRRW